MQTISMDAFSESVQAKLIEQDLRVRPWPSAKRMWDRVFVESDHIRLGGSFSDAYQRRGTIGMWMDVRGVSAIRALIDLSLAIGFLSPEQHRWLLRETGEADGERLMQTAIESGGLVLSEQRDAYFGGESIEVDWQVHDKSWNFLWELARAAKRGRLLDHFALGEDAKPKTVGDRKHRLKALVPTALFDRIHRKRGAGCHLDLPANMIRLFVHDPSDLLVEWTGWDPSRDY